VKEKPTYEVNTFLCPRCGQIENVGLVHDTEAVVWCACGAVLLVSWLSETPERLTFQPIHDFLEE